MDAPLPVNAAAGALPQDPALPHLATALDEDAMAALFGARLAAEGGPALAACRIDRIKYRPRRNCSVSYRLDLRDDRGRAFEQAVSTRWCSSAEDAAQRHAHVLARPHRASCAGPALWHMSALDMVATWLPNDPKLDALPGLLDDAALRTRWLPEVAAALVPGARLLHHRTTLVQWVPEQRACARVELRLAAGDSAIHAHTLYVKTDAEGGGALTHAVMQALHANRRLRTPRPVAWQPAAGLQWQQAIAGRPLADLGELTPQRAAQVGELLTQLHATPVPLPASRCLTLENLRGKRRDAAQAIGSALPALQGRLLVPLLHALERACDALPLSPPATLHGDLHRTNLLVANDDTLALIDLDSVKRGPASIELGGWIAEAMFLALLDGKPAHSAAPHWRAMLRAYAQASGRPMPDEPELAWATAHQLLDQRAYRCVANLKPGRLAIVPALLRAAEAIARERTLDAVEGLA